MLKKFSCIILSIIICISLNINVFAGSVEPYDGQIIEIPNIEEVQKNKETNINGENNANSRASSVYTYVGVMRYWGLIRYYDYHCYKDTAYNYYAQTGLNLTMAVYHKKNSGSKSLSFTIAQTYKSETANSFSTKVGGEAGIGDMVKASAELGYGITKTVGREYQISSTIQANIPASATTGYYKMHVCYNLYDMKIVRQRTDGTNKETRYISMPYGESYAAVLFSSSSEAGTWSKW